MRMNSLSLRLALPPFFSRLSLSSPWVVNFSANWWRDDAPSRIWRISPLRCGGGGARGAGTLAALVSALIMCWLLVASWHRNHHRGSLRRQIAHFHPPPPTTGPARLRCRHLADVMWPPVPVRAECAATRAPRFCRHTQSGILGWPRREGVRARDLARVVPSPPPPLACVRALSLGFWHRARYWPRAIGAPLVALWDMGQWAAIR